jgi:YVTN family beta-propeller protein
LPADGIDASSGDSHEFCEWSKRHRNHGGRNLSTFGGRRPASNKIYVANEASGNVTMIEGANNSTATVVVGTNPSSLAVNPQTKKYLMEFLKNL